MAEPRFQNRKGQDGKPVLALFIFALAALSFIAPKQARAAAGEHGVGLGLGQVLLMGDFAKNFSDSLGFQGIYSYEASQVFGLLVNLSLSSHSNADASNTLSLKALSPNLRINLAYIDKLVLYTFGGFGLVKADEKIGALQGSVTTLGFNLGAAFYLALDKHFQFGTQLSFHNVFGKTDPTTVTATNPNGLSVGGTYLGLFLNVMYIF